MGRFDKFNSAMNEDTRKAIDEAKQNTGFSEVPKGKYITKIEKMELGATKDGRPMFTVQMRLIEGDGAAEKEFLSKYKNKKPCIFMNRVMAGTKNDANMIASVEGWLSKLDEESPVMFMGNYDEFADELMDLAEDVQDCEFLVEYDEKAFNSISIKEIYD